MMRCFALVTLAAVASGQATWQQDPTWPISSNQFGLYDTATDTWDGTTVPCCSSQNTPDWGGGQFGGSMRSALCEDPSLPPTGPSCYRAVMDGDIATVYHANAIPNANLLFDFGRMMSISGVRISSFAKRFGSATLEVSLDGPPSGTWTSVGEPTAPEDPGTSAPCTPLPVHHTLLASYHCVGLLLTLFVGRQTRLPISCSMPSLHDMRGFETSLSLVGLDAAPLLL